MLRADAPRPSLKESEFRADDRCKREEWLSDGLSCRSGLAPLQSSSGLCAFTHTAVSQPGSTVCFSEHKCKQTAKKKHCLIQNRYRYIVGKMWNVFVAGLTVGIWPKNPIFSGVPFRVVRPACSLSWHMKLWGGGHVVTASKLALCSARQKEIKHEWWML